MWWIESSRDVDAEGDLLPFRLVELTDEGETVRYGGRTLVKAGWSIRLDRPDADDPWTALQIFDPDQRFQTYLCLVHEAVPHVPAATYDVGGADDEMSFQVHAELEGEAGASGNVVLTQSSADRVAGWYVVTLTDGGAVSGSFDVPIRMRTTWPR